MRFNPRIARFEPPEGATDGGDEHAEFDFPAGELSPDLEALGSQLMRESLALAEQYPPKADDDLLPVPAQPAQQTATAQEESRSASSFWPIGGGLAAAAGLALVLGWQFFGPDPEVAHRPNEPSASPAAEVEIREAVAPQVAAPMVREAVAPVRPLVEARTPPWEVLSGPEREGWLDGSAVDVPEGGFSI